MLSLPHDLVLRILDHLPTYAKPWYRGLFKPSAAQFGPDVVILARQPDLPMWLVQQRFADLKADLATPEGVSRSKSTAKKQSQLLASRAAAGDLAGVQWLRSQGCAWGSHCCIAAAESGHLSILQWMLSQRPSCPIDGGLCALAAAAAGQLGVLRFLQTERLLRPFDIEACAEAAAAAGQQNVLQWLALQDHHVTVATALTDSSAAASARQQLQQIMMFARGRTPPLLLARA